MSIFFTSCINVTWVAVIFEYSSTR